MFVKNYLSENYPVTEPYCGINSIENRLIESGYLVIMDEENGFIGILTPVDLIQRPHKLVIDCFTEKDRLNQDDTLLSSFDKFHVNKTSALPVFNENEFCGIIEKQTVADALASKINELHEKSIISQKVKTAFLNNLYHEVRTPLNSIAGFLGLLTDLDDDCKEDCKEFFRTVRDNTDHFLLLMDDLVELALLQSGDTVKFNKKDCLIESIFDELNELFKVEILRLKKDIVLNYANPDLSFVLNTDGDRLKHILFHLIGNAIKFSDKGNVIYGYAIKEKKNVEFFVYNSGTIIPDKYSSRIFEAFEKIENITNEFSDGLGIGLTVASKLADLLGGNICFESDVKKGTTFYLTLGIN